MLPSNPSSSSSFSSSCIERYHEPSSPPPTSPKVNLLCGTIREFLDKSGSCDLVLSASYEEYLSFERELNKPIILTGKEVDSIRSANPLVRKIPVLTKLRYDYEPDKNRLTIKGMPASVHNGIIPYLVKLRTRFVVSGFLTIHELENHVHYDYGTDVVLPGLGGSLDTTSRKKYTTKKQPDAAFYYINRSGAFPKKDAFPRIVFEVAFSQSYDSVVQDAHQWLVRSGGLVQLVVVVKLDEGVYPQVVADQEETEKEGEEDHDTHTASSIYSSEFSSPAGYEHWVAHCDPNDWIGPITGFIELYRYNTVTKKAEMDGSRYVCFHLTITAYTDHIYIGFLSRIIS